MRIVSEVAARELKSLIQICKSYGNDYSPAKASIELFSLETKLAEATSAIERLRQSQSVFANSIVVRETTFQKLGPVLKNAITFLIQKNVSPLVIREARKLYKKIMTSLGVAVNKSLQLNATTTRPRYDRMIILFDMFIDTLALDSAVIQSEGIITVASHKNKLAELRKINDLVGDLGKALGKARVTRNKVFYQERQGLVDTMISVRKYLKSKFKRVISNDTPHKGAPRRA